MITIHGVENPTVSYNEKGKHGQTYSFIVDIVREGEVPLSGITVTCKFLDGDFVEHLHSRRPSTLEESRVFGTVMSVNASLTTEDIQAIQAYYESVYPDHDYYRQLGKKEQLMEFHVRSNKLDLGERPVVVGRHPYDLITTNGLTKKVWFEAEPNVGEAIMVVFSQYSMPLPFSILSIDERKKVIKVKPYEKPKFNYCISPNY